MKSKIFLIPAIAALLLAACSDFLKEESQSEVIPKTASDFSELLLGTGYPSKGTAGATPDITFLSLMDDDCNFFLSCTNNGSYTDEPHVGSTEAITALPIYSWQPYLADYDGAGNEINTTASSTTYAGFYSKILGCNSVLDYIDDAIGTPVEKDRVKAEALALRAFYYFQLVNIYGEPYNYNKNALGVPLKLDANLTENPIERATVAYIYEEIVVKDLVEAARLMDPLTIMRQNFRINQPAIHILLSRVYLYMEEYDKCISEVDKAMTQKAKLANFVNSTVVTGSNLVSYSNPEIEWLFGPPAIASNNAYSAGAGSSPFRDIWSDPNDKRISLFGLTLQWGNYVYLNKPTSTYSFGQSLRAAEAYLNRAEAYALSGNEPGALSDLNELRRNRITGYQDVTLSGQTLIDAIRLERRKELCFEGHRWFDLRRYGMPEIKHMYKFEKGGATVEFTLKEKDPMYTVPFPNSVLEKNRGLKQNASRNGAERIAE